MIKSAFKKVFAYVKKNFFSCTCVLLSVLVVLTGSFSYSKYITNDSAGSPSGVGSFSCSSTIDGISALSFTNTAFWGGTMEGDKISMNALRSINFSVNNFNVVNGVEKVAEVKMKYSLTFSAPANFVEKLAMQLFDEHESAMLPQIVFRDMMEAAEHGHDFQTAISEDYNSVYHHDLTFEIEKKNNNYTAVFDGHIHEEEVKVVIKLEEFEQETHQLLNFRSWDTSNLTDENNPTVDEEGGKLLPPIEVKFKRHIPFYKITISMSNMVLPANQKTTVKHSVKLAPTDSINDDHLAGYFVYNNNGNYEPVTSLYGASVEGESIQFQMQTVKEHSVDKYYTSAEAFTAQDKTPYIKENHFGEHQIVNHSENLVGHPEHYIVGETGYFDNTTTINYLELGSFTKEDREFIDGQYIYLRRSGTTNNSTWQLINESDVPNNINFNNRNVYYRLYVKYGEIINKTELKLTAGTLRTEVASIDSFTVKSVTEDAEKKHFDIVFDVVSSDSLRYYIQDGASGTKTVTKILDIEEEGLVLYVKNGRNWQTATDVTITMPNHTIQPLVSSTQNYSGVSETLVYENATTDYIIKELFRDINRVTIDVEEVMTTIINAEGNPEDIYYTQSNPLNLFEGNIQKIYLSQCYSKNYPFYVNVLFEQIQ